MGEATMVATNIKHNSINYFAQIPKGLIIEHSFNVHKVEYSSP